MLRRSVDCPPLLIKELTIVPIQLTRKWKEDELAGTHGEQPIVNVYEWLSRTTLDVIGDGKSGITHT